eukprot:2471228-Prymnesium_polylepis.1
MDGARRDPPPARYSRDAHRHARTAMRAARRAPRRRPCHPTPLVAQGLRGGSSLGVVSRALATKLAADLLPEMTRMQLPRGGSISHEQTAGEWLLLLEGRMPCRVGSMPAVRVNGAAYGGRSVSPDAERPPDERQDGWRRRGSWPAANGVPAPPRVHTGGSPPASPQRNGHANGHASPTMARPGGGGMLGGNVHFGLAPSPSAVSVGVSLRYENTPDSLIGDDAEVRQEWLEAGSVLWE